MGSIIYSFLSESLLLDPSLVGRRFEGIADKALAIELNRYREFCLKHLDVLSEEVEPESGKLKIYAGSEASPRLLRQGAFYLDAVILQDPLFALTEPEHRVTAVWSKAFDMPRREGVDRGAIAIAAQQLVDSHAILTHRSGFCGIQQAGRQF